MSTDGVNRSTTDGRSASDTDGAIKVGVGWKRLRDWLRSKTSGRSATKQK